MKGTIRFILGLLMVMGAVGGMDDPTKFDYFYQQLALAALGLAIMAWAVRDINRQADKTIDTL
jgi:cell division protein FtsW (lipid II flippase)